MQEITNQTLYQCDYCFKRLLSKNGAKIHEEQYCSSSPIAMRNRLDEIQNCNHKWHDTYSYIPGEAVRQPESEECEICRTYPGEEKRLILDIEIATAENSD